MLFKIIPFLFLTILSFSLAANHDLFNGIPAYNKDNDIKETYIEAIPLLKKAAEQGDVYAQGNLGFMYANGLGVARDDKQAAIWYSKAAEQGDSNAQFNLGFMYDEGIGVAKDDKQAVIWYLKAAEQGNIYAQGNLGFMYANGRGVVKDDKQAVFWYRKAAEQGSAYAQGNLGFMYENGRGVNKNEKQALTLYKKSNTSWSKKKYVTLKKQLDCKANNKTQLFGVFVKCTNRDTLMAAVKLAGANVKSEDKRKWVDIYYTKNLLKGSSELRIDYTVDDYFAKAAYTFPSNMDSKQVTHIRDLVVNKYGEPDYSNGRAALGDVTYKWNLEDGIELKVARGWPNTTTYLSFTYPKNYQAMMTEQEKQKKARETKQYEAQKNAF